MNKKAFTLIELVGVITILGVISVLMVPAIIKQINKKEDKIDEITKELIYSAVDLYVDNKKIEYPLIEGSIYCVDLQKIVDDDKLPPPLLDSEGNIISLETKISLFVKNGKYKYELVDSCEKSIAQHVVGNYYYTGNIETFIVPYTGIYKLEVWGAQGGDANKSIGGFGGYSVGLVKLNYAEELNIVVGGQGETCSTYSKCALGGYNGGGSSCGNHDTLFSAGGGATHIAKKTGLLKELSTNVSSILIVAGGGGGAGYYTGVTTSYYGKINNGGSGGGYTGVNGGGPSYGKSGTQSAGGKGNTTGNAKNGAFGQGGGGTSNIASAGGGGYYGGGTGFDFGSAAGGGSGYIANSSLYDKHMACYNCSTSQETDKKTISNKNVSSSPMSDYSKIGHGYAKITFIGLN